MKNDGEVSDIRCFFWWLTHGNAGRRTLKTSIKRCNAEFHSQAVLEGILELKAQSHLCPAEIECIEIEIFAVAYHIIGGGKEGEKCQIHTKEEADHSLPYLVAVAPLERAVTPAQYAPERITREDVQSLLWKVRIQPDETLSARFPAEMPCRLCLFLRDRRVLALEKRGGFMDSRGDAENRKERS